MIIAQVLFWISVAALVYHLAGYPFILAVFNRLRKKTRQNPPEPTEFPRVTVLCPARNEEDAIEAKIRSFLALDYPPDRLKMIVISDDSTDRTNEIVSRFESQNVELVVQKPRQGKPSAHNLVIPRLDCDYVLSTDANSIFAPDALRLLVAKMLSDPRLAVVSGELRLIPGEGQKSGEGLYWRYESRLKQLDSDFHSLIGANGSLFLIRRDHFQPVDPQSVDDFERVLTVLKSGFLAAYEPRANVFERETEAAGQEMARKIRIVTREWYVLERNLKLLNPFRHPATSFQLVSHKLLRWLFFVFVLTGFLASALLLKIWFYRVTFLLQALIYGLGALGLVFQARGRRLPLSTVPAYLVAMIWSSLAAFVRYLLRTRANTWNPVR
ncbi:MAG: glycosyltransferase family 2 protein [Candidatus Cloacimonetes bacterium]|jgi:cellulose synthase/poly-beta-1,6-N-acetylglucosamine synthase-like glycosyltransferase|nr:glycosyltransferase family 2 protein [Candidatus Cloacimonadota bacterium]MDY0366711.1 glycosyltransferase family 2 protein [Candidatus Syntrophosphaera sp.]